MYKALLVRLDKRFSSRYQFTVSYALQSSQSVLDVTQNLNDYFATYGPDAPHHNLGIGAMVDLKAGIPALTGVVIPEPWPGRADHQRLRQHRHEHDEQRATRRCSRSSARDTQGS